jgi:hypothetical protein
MSHVLPRQTAPEVDAGNPAHAVLPVGSFEQQGPYLPLMTDTVVAPLITGELAEAYGLFALPPVPVSCSHEHHAWRATLSVPSAVLAAYVSGIRDSVANSGFGSPVLVNGHGGNYVLANVVQEAAHRAGAWRCSPRGKTGGRRGSTLAWTPPITRTCTPGNLRPASCCTPRRTWSARATSPPTTWPTTAARTPDGIPLHEGTNPLCPLPRPQLEARSTSTSAS